MLKTLLVSPRRTLPAVALAASAQPVAARATASRAAVSVVAGADLQVSYTGTTSIYTSPGYGFAEYTFQVRNRGPLDADDVQVTGVSLIVASDSQQVGTEEAAAFLTSGGTTTTLKLGTIKPGQTKSLTVVCAATPFNSCAGSEVRVNVRGSDDGVTASSPGYF